MVICERDKRLIILTFCIVLLAGSVIAPQAILGTYKKGECFDLLQVCDTCTYNNITDVIYPNNSAAISNVTMTKRGTNYIYSFCKTNILGKYIVSGYGDLDGTKTAWAYEFEITGTGFEFTQPRSSTYIGMLAILVFFFIVNIGGISLLPSSNSKDEYGSILGINNLKYLRAVLWVVAWGLLMAITFTASNVSLAYLGSEMFGKLLFAFFQILMFLSLPMIIIWFVFLFKRIFEDKEVKRLIGRGIPVGGNI